jgi:hypothetical protein
LAATNHFRIRTIVEKVSAGHLVNALLTILIRVNIPATAESQYAKGISDEEADPRIPGLAAWWWLEQPRSSRLRRFAGFSLAEVLADSMH